MLSAEIRADYFAALANRYRWHQRIANWITLFLSSGAALSILLDLPNSLKWLRPVFALATTAISAYSIVAQNYDRAMNAMDLHARWNRLSKQYASLWDRMDSPEALDQLTNLEEIGGELSKTGITFPNRTKELLKWQQLVEQQFTARFQT